MVAWLARVLEREHRWLLRGAESLMPEATGATTLCPDSSCRCAGERVLPDVAYAAQPGGER